MGAVRNKTEGLAALCAEGTRGRRNLKAVLVGNRLNTLACLLADQRAVAQGARNRRLGNPGQTGNIGYVSYGFFSR